MMPKDQPHNEPRQESAEEAVIVKSFDGRIVSWSETAERMFGYPAEEAVGKHISIVIPFDYQDQEYEMMDNLRANDSLTIPATMRRAKDGELFAVTLSATAMRNEQGHLVGAVKRVRRLPEGTVVPPPVPQQPVS